VSLALGAVFASKFATALVRRKALPVKFAEILFRPAARLDAFDSTNLSEPVATEGKSSWLFGGLCHDSIIALLGLFAMPFSINFGSDLHWHSGGANDDGFQR
jgi:hypothetical protein